MTTKLVLLAALSLAMAACDDDAVGTRDDPGRAMVLATAGVVETGLVDPNAPDDRQLR